MVRSRTLAHSWQCRADDDGEHGPERVGDDDDGDGDDVCAAVLAAHRTAMVDESAAVADHASVR